MRWLQIALLLIMVLLVAPVGIAADSDAFIWPGNGVPEDRPVWGHADGLRIGIAPTPGPRGLIRVYAPYLGQSYPRVVNFLSIEPSAVGQEGRGQSELATSRVDPGVQGLRFTASDSLSSADPSAPVRGDLDETAGTLRLFIHTEAFASGAKPIVEILFRRDNRHELELVLHAARESAPLRECVVSATMGNYGLLRQLHLREGCVAFAPQLSEGSHLDALGFYPWRTFPHTEFPRRADGTIVVRATSDVADMREVSYEESTAEHWRYTGTLASHYWRAHASDQPTIAVNGRSHYWQSRTPIPGGVAFENIELRMPFREGLRMWFGVQPR